MKKLIVLLSILGFIYSDAKTQNRLQRNLPIGRVYTTENMSRTIYPQLWEAEVQVQMLDHEQALIHLDNAIADNPGVAEAYILRARVKRMMGMAESARDDMKKASRLNPYSADIFGYNGINGLINAMYFEPRESMASLDLSQKSEYYLKEIESKEASAEMDTEYLNKLEIALVLIEDKNWDSALEELNEVVELNPNSHIAFDLKGLVFTETGQLEAAIDAFSESVAIEPRFSISWYNLGRIEKLRGNLDKAREYFDRAIEMEDSLTKAYFYRAKVLKSMGMEKEAIKDYNTIIKKKGDKYIEAYINRGLTLKSLGDFVGAKRDLDKAIEDNPQNPDVYKNRGNLYLLFGNHTEAMIDYTKAIELNPEYSEAYFNRGLARLMILDNISACADFQQSAELGSEKAQEHLIYFCRD